MDYREEFNALGGGGIGTGDLTLTLYASENKFGGANSYVAEYVYNSETDRWYKCSPSINTAAMNGDIKNQVYGSIKNGSEIIYGSELVNVTWTEVPGFSPFLK